MTRLSGKTVDQLNPHISVPVYDRSVVDVGIVHFGVGAFHRSHQAVYLDDALAGGELSWGVCGVGVLPTDQRIRDVLDDQDGLYTLLTVDTSGDSRARVIGSHVLHLHAPDDPFAVLDRLTDPAVRIVSLTITEGGYSVNDATGAFEPRDAATLADLAGAQPPATAFGFIVSALAARRAAGTPPFTVMSCDNIQHNGRVARAAITAFALHVDPELAEWIGQHVTFPNSMVDRITPATTPDVIAAVNRYGVEDGWPIRAEAFTQWVLEDNFSSGRPALDKVGVQLVEDVTPYEYMKLRLLNASHQVMSYLGLLAGETYVHDVCRDADFVGFLLAYMHKEAIPTLDPVPGVDLELYCNQLIDRFSSEAILDTLARQTVDGSDRVPKFLLPVIQAQLDAGRDIRRATLALAAWSRYLDPELTPETAPPPNDRRIDTIRAAAIAERSRPGAFLDQPDVFGDLGQDLILRTAFTRARSLLSQGGARAAVTLLA